VKKEGLFEILWFIVNEIQSRVFKRIARPSNGTIDAVGQWPRDKGIAAGSADWMRGAAIRRAAECLAS